MVESPRETYAILRRNHGEIRCVVELPRFTFAPVTAGQQVGQLRFFENAPDGSRTEIGQAPLTASYGVEAVTYKKSLWDRLTSLRGR